MSPQNGSPRSPAKKPIKRTPPAPKGAPVPRHQRRIRVEGRMAQYLNGEISIEDMDAEELARGRFRDKNGGFTGRPPATVPREFFDACTRELLKRANETFASALVDVVESLTGIATSPAVDAKDRIAAGKLIVERVMGRVPDKLEVKAQLAKWEQNIDKIIAD